MGDINEEYPVIKVEIVNGIIDGISFRGKRVI